MNKRKFLTLLATATTMPAIAKLGGITTLVKPAMSTEDINAWLTQDIVPNRPPLSTSWEGYYFPDDLIARSFIPRRGQNQLKPSSAFVHVEYDELTKTIAVARLNKLRSPLQRKPIYEIVSIEADFADNQNFVNKVLDEAKQECPSGFSFTRGTTASDKSARMAAFKEAIMDRLLLIHYSYPIRASMEKTSYHPIRRGVRIKANTMMWCLANAYTNASLAIYR